jgi:heparan-alpha-glucosaminide N-acetyltransferase
MEGMAALGVSLVVVGMNSIAIYVMSWTMEPFFYKALHIHLGWLISGVVGPTFQPVVYGLGIMLIYWLILFWMYRRKIYVKI